jgi:hypothetical protein
MHYLAFTLFALTFTWFMVTASSRRRVLAVAVAGILVSTLLIAPPVAEAQGGIVQAIQAVLSAINGVIHNALNAINTVRTEISYLYQSVIWPMQLINQSRALVTQMINQYRSLMAGILGMNLRSATLSNPQALETVIRDHQVNNFSTLTQSYGTTYGAIPTAAAATQADRDMSDMDDAFALDSLKTLKISDNAISDCIGSCIEHSQSSHNPENARRRTKAGSRAHSAPKWTPEAGSDIQHANARPDDQSAAAQLSPKGETMKSFREYLNKAKYWILGHKVRTAALTLVLVITAPWPAKGQFLDPCCALMAAGLSSISSALQNVVGGGLNQIYSVDEGTQQFQQNVVWPLKLINQARALVGGLEGIFSQIYSLTHMRVNSATLPNSQQLEVNLLSRNANLIGQTSTNYTALYGQVPMTTDASPQMRDMIDMTDAISQDAMKRAIEIDALSDLELQAASQINQSVQNAAPGSAPIIEAQADAWLVRANAYTQAATADLMRLRAIDLANSSADIKMGATNTTNLRQQLMNLLQHN